MSTARCFLNTVCRKPPLFSVQDTHTDEHAELSVDRQQDYVLDLVHVTSAGSLVVEFHRQYDTCDIEDDYLIDVSINSAKYTAGTRALPWLTKHVLRFIFV